MKNNLTEEHITRLTALKNVLLLILTVIDLIFIILSTTYSISFRVERLIADYDLLVCILLFLLIFAMNFIVVTGALRSF